MCGGCPIWGKQRIAGWEPFTTAPKGDRRTVAWTKLDAGLGIFPALVSICLYQFIGIVIPGGACPHVL